MIKHVVPASGLHLSEAARLGHSSSVKAHAQLHIMGISIRHANIGVEDFVRPLTIHACEVAASTLARTPNRNSQIPQE